jgi:hypothetical protein
MTEAFLSIRLHKLAHARAGDKGDRLSIGLFSYQQELFKTLEEYVTEEHVYSVFEHRGVSAVKRYLLPRLNGMNFVIENVLGGGVNSSLNLDGHGKSSSFLLLSSSILLSAELLQRHGIELD